MKVIFFGTPNFSAQVLTYLLENGIDIVAVVSKPDRPKGRSLMLTPTPVKTAALTLRPDMPIYQPEIVSSPDFSAILEAYKADLFVVVAYGEIIKQHLLDMPRLGCINLHVSLLPKYRGAAPIQRCIIEGEKESGATVMHMVKKMDAGDIIEVVRTPIEPYMTFGELEQTLCTLGKQLLLHVIHDFEAGIIKRLPQDSTQATLAPKIELEDCEIHWENPADKIHNLIRGVNPYPGAWCYVLVKGEKKRLKINRSRVHFLPPNSPTPHALAPGSIISSHKENILITTGQHALELLEVQLEGKKVMSSKDLIQGLSLGNLSFK